MAPNRLIAILLTATLLSGCAGSPVKLSHNQRNRFIGFSDFSRFAKENGAAGEIVLTSPEIPPPIAWDELVVSWNLPASVHLKMEARGIYPDHSTKFYTLGYWSADPSTFPRRSEANQSDEDGMVKTDTLVMNRPGAKVQLRISLGLTDTNSPAALKFLALSFCNSAAPAKPREPNRAAWGKTLDVPERVQSGYDGPGGWCSPTCVSMVMAYWSAALHRPELDRTVPEVAAAVDDPVYRGTGNWPFNAAYAGTFPGMRAYVTRLDDISEQEDWVAAGIPVVLSVSSYLTNDRHSGPDNGHLIVCVGFTESGDMIANDPGVSLLRGEHVRRIYPREKVVEAWKKSKNTVYLIYPENAAIPEDMLGHWEHRD